jgi:hypothetical protein
MRTCFGAKLLLLVAVALLAVPIGAAAAADNPNEVEQKLQDVRKQIDDLRRQERALLKARERLREETAEKKAQYASVEIRGRLHKESTGHLGGNVWMVSFGELDWLLDLGRNKELLAAAEQQAGKTVLVTGRVEGRRDLWHFGPVEVVVVEALTPAER